MEAGNLTERGLEYGQREPLTRRIRTLLKDYPDGLTVPKELIQNADDAQATKACLLLDLRTHANQNLISPALAEIQGPAIVFWNNKPFKKSDFENLCEFGGETKLADRKKVGKFGLGFNCVYNLTDVPQFVSGEYYCILDPHEKFLDRMRGVQFPLTNRTDGNFLADLIKGHLDPFENLFGFSMEHVKNGKAYDGTIFRLPLRTEENIKWSKISATKYTLQSARELIEMIKLYSDLLLIFLQFVNEFDIAIIHENSSLEKLGSFKRTFVIGSDPCMAQVLFREDEMFRGSYQIRIEESIAMKIFQWDIFLSIPGLRSEQDGTRCVGAIAFPSKDLKLESNTEKQLLFCFLPLPHPSCSGLPFLVNGSFAVTSSRRHLEVESVDDRSEERRIQAQWNRDILQHAAAPALCDAVLAKASTHTQDQLFNLFPNYSKESERLPQLLSETFLEKLITDPEMKVFASSNSDELVAFADERVVIIAQELPEDVRLSLTNCAAYSDSNEEWICLNQKVRNSLASFDDKRFRAKEQNFYYFFKALIFKADVLFVNMRQNYLTIVHYALSLSHADVQIKEMLETVPWVATASNDDCGDEMKLPNELVHPQSPAAELLYFDTKFFPSGSMNLTDEHLELMCQLFGMKKQTLPKQAILEIISNLNSLQTWPEINQRFKAYVEHLNSNGRHYMSPPFAVKNCCNGLLIPKMDDNGQLQKLEDWNVYQLEVKAIVGYIHQTCNFGELGIHQNSFADHQMKLFKKVSLNDVLKNWRLLIADQSILFTAKCEQIFVIVQYLKSNYVSESDKATVRRSLDKEALLPASESDEFYSLTKLCLNQKAPTFDQHIYHIHPSLIVNETMKNYIRQLGVPEFYIPTKYVQVVEGLTSLDNELQVKQIREVLEFLRAKGVKCLKLPDEDRIMQNTNNLCLNDFQLSDMLNELKPIHCHKDIPHDLARYFGVKTKRSMLEELSSDPSFEVFSQREDLCNRLKRITMSYSNPMDVFKELIQNADDAKASEIHFILDERVLEKSRVVNENWEKLLDPALLVFNDAFFTTQDIEGIKDLGKGSKSSNVDKIGQFGVGFNCVYTLTDFPCFLTQVDGKGMGNLCLFDPSCQITPWCGKKININDDNLNNFPDTFGCFLTEESEFNATMGKTMFRLPLRKKRIQAS